MRAPFKALSLLRDVRAFSRGPHAVIARTARKAIHRATNRRINREHYEGYSCSQDEIDAYLS